MARFLFHKTEAPDGRLFADDVDDPEGWVDTPAKFDPHYVAPPALDGSVNVAGRGLYVPQAFPAHFYNRAGDVKDVANAEQFEMLDPDVWKDSPAAFDVVPEKRANDEPPFVLTADQIADIYGSTVETLKTAIADIVSEAKLAAIESAEASNPKGPRQGVFKALAARRAELTA